MMISWNYSSYIANKCNQNISNNLKIFFQKVRFCHSSLSSCFIWVLSKSLIIVNNRLNIPVFNIKMHQVTCQQSVLNNSIAINLSYGNMSSRGYINRIFWECICSFMVYISSAYKLECYVSKVTKYAPFFSFHSPVWYVDNICLLIIYFLQKFSYVKNSFSCLKINQTYQKCFWPMTSAEI